MYKYHGELVKLGTRLVRLPDDKDIKRLKPRFEQWAYHDAVQPIYGDIITIDDSGDEWLVDSRHCGISKACDAWNGHVALINSRRSSDALAFERQSNLLVAYDESALGAEEDHYPHVSNRRQVMFTEINIVGQAKAVRFWARVPDIPGEMILPS